MAGRVELSVVAKNQASSVLKQIGGDIRGLGKEAGSAKGALGQMFSVDGRDRLARGIQSAASAVAGLGKAFVGAVADMTMDAAAMNAQVSGIGAVLGLTTAELGKVKGLINDLGVDPNLKVNATEAANAIDMLARNGLNLDQILGGAARATVFLANATGGTFDTSANVATDAMAMFKIKAEDMMTAVDGITSVTVASKFGLDDYQRALSQAGGVASALGVEFDDFNTTIAATSSSFASGSDAGTSYKTFLQRLVPQSDEAVDAMGELGLYGFNAEKAMTTLSSMGIKPLSNDMGTLIDQLMSGYAATHKVNLGTEKGLQAFNDWARETGFVQSAFYDANGQMKSMADISAALNEATAGLTEEQKNQYLTTIFGSDAMRTAFGLAEKGQVIYTDVAKAAQELGVSQQDLAKYADGGITAFEALQATMGKTDALKGAQMRVDNLSGDMEIFSGIVDSVRMQIGDKFDPVLRGVFQGLTSTFTSLTPQILAFGDAIANNVAAGVQRLSSAFAVFQSGGSIADIGAALGLSPTFIGMLEAAYQNVDLLVGALKGIGVALGVAATIARVTAAITGLLNPITLVIGGAALLGAAWETNFGGIQDITADVAQSIGNVVTAIQDFLTGADISAATTALTQSFTGVKNALGELFTGDIGVGEFASKISDAVSGIPDMVRNVFAGSDFSAMKGEIITALGLDNVSFDLSALQTNISTAIGGIDWSQVAMQFSTLKDSVGTALNSVRDGVLSSLTAAVNGVDWSAISFDFAGMIDSVTSTINGIDWSQISIEDIGLALAGVVMPVLTNSIRAIAWVLNSDSWSGLTASVKNALASIEWGEIGQSFLGLGSTILDAITGLDWSTITGAFESLQTSVSSTMSGLDWSTTTSAFGTLVSTVTGALSSIDWSTAVTEFNSLKTSVVDTMSGIDWSGVSSAFDALKTAVSSTLTGINWSEVLPNLAASASALRDNLIQSLADKINGIDWSQISLNVAGFINKIASTISGIDWSQAVVNVAGFISSIAGKISSIDWSQISVGEIGAALGTVVAPALTAGIAGITWVLSSENWGNLLSAVTGSIAEIDWGPIGEAFGNLATAVVDSVTNIDWSPIGSAFGSLATSVVDAITNIDWSGVSAPFYALKDSIQNAVNSALSTISFGLLGGGAPSTQSSQPAQPSKPSKPSSGIIDSILSGVGLASGTDNWRGGWTWVGERGPELLNLPKGSQILSNTESNKMIGQLADGTTTAAATGSAPRQQGNVFSAIANAAKNFGQAGTSIQKAASAMSKSVKDLEAGLRKVPGLFSTSQVTEQQMKMGELGIPQNFADDWIRRLTDEVVNGVDWEGVDIKDAAARAGINPALPAEAILEMVKEKWNDKSLFADSKNLDLINMDAVKAAMEQQAQAKLGETNFLNFLGITPQQTGAAGASAGAAVGTGMLTGITAALGADGGAGTQVATALSTGVTPESMAPVGVAVVGGLTTELAKEEYGTQIGAALTGLFTGYLDKADSFVEVAQAIMAKISNQFGNVTGMDIVAKFTDAFRAQLGTDDAVASLARVGEKILELVFRGYLDEARKRNWAEGVNAKGDTATSAGGTSTSSAPTSESGGVVDSILNSIGLANGTTDYAGGWTMVGERGRELVNLPRGSNVYSNRDTESMLSRSGRLAPAMAGGGDSYVINNHFTVGSEIDYERAAYRIADIIRRRR